MGVLSIRTPLGQKCKKKEITDRVCVCVYQRAKKPGSGRWSTKVLPHSEWALRLMHCNIQEGGTFGC